MSVLSGKKVLLGITGGIAAYKTAHLVRLLIKSGAEVQVVLTPSASDFVAPLTLSTLSKREVYSQLYQNQGSDKKWINHVELALWADFILIAPTTANTLAKMASGVCDNLLLAVYFSAKCKVFFAPAMDLDMYRHPSVKENIKKLESYSNVMIPVEQGELASGLIGYGRMSEPENILSFLVNHFSESLKLQSKKVLITAGPTFEPIDPVRFIGNHSTGKMGFAIALEAANQGADVVLVSGPTHLKLEHSKVKLISVQTAIEMYQACDSYFDSSDIFISAAAVADYRPKEVSEQKIKKNDSTLEIILEKNIDVLHTLSQRKKQQFLVGFALETEKEQEHAILKIKKKNLDLIVLNSLNDTGAGFGKPTNKVTFIDSNFEVFPMELKSKEEVAKDIIQQITKRL